MLVVIITVKWNKSIDRAGSAVTDKLINLIHQENFNVAVFKEMIKKSGHCLAITREVIGGCKNY